MELTLFQGKEEEGLLVPWPVRMSVVRYFGPLCKGITRNNKKSTRLGRSGNRYTVGLPLV